MASSCVDRHPTRETDRPRQSGVSECFEQFVGSEVGRAGYLFSFSRNQEGKVMCGTEMCVIESGHENRKFRQCCCVGAVARGGAWSWRREGLWNSALIPTGSGDLANVNCRASARLLYMWGC